MSALVAIDTLRSRLRKNVNLLGVVVEYGIPQPSRGTNLTMSLKIVDTSQHEVSVNMFMDAFSEFPAIKAAGDVIYLNSVSVEIYENRPGAVFKKASSRFSIYSGNDIGNFVPYMTSSPCGLPDLVKKEIDRLRLWYRNSRLNTGENKYLVSISEMMKMHFFDLVCKVLFTRAESENEISCFCLYVWDGTDAPLEVMNTEFREEDQTSPPTTSDFDSIPGDILKSFPQAGSVLKVIIQVCDDGLGDHFSLTNSWVRLRNLHCKSIRDKWDLRSKHLKIRRLPDTDLIVQERKRNYEQRIKEMEAVNG